MSAFSPTTRVAAFLRDELALVSKALLLAGALLLVPPLLHFMIGVNAQAGPPPPAAPAGAAREAPVLPAEGELLGRLEIPRIGIDLAVFEGTTDATLRKGPGHLPGTPWPPADARAGNCVIAGHRDSFFRRLERARENDVVRLSGARGVETYRLDRRRIVRPREVSVLAATGEARLTLITCYPFRWWGEAPYRLVWSAVRIEDIGAGIPR